MTDSISPRVERNVNRNREQNDYRKIRSLDSQTSSQMVPRNFV